MSTIIVVPAWRLMEAVDTIDYRLVVDNISHYEPTGNGTVITMTDGLRLDTKMSVADIDALCGGVVRRPGCVKDVT